MNVKDADISNTRLAEAWEAGYAAGRSDEFAAGKGFTGYHANPYEAAK